MSTWDIVKNRRHAITTLAVIAAASCSESADTITAAEWEVISTLSPLPERPPADPTNAYEDDPGAAALGQKLFFESSFAGPLMVGDDGQNGALGAAGESGKMSCASCHMGPWLIDLRTTPNATSLGSGWFARNSATLINVAYYEHHWYESDGLLDSIWGESIVDVEFDLGFNSSRLRLAHVVFDEYREEYEAVFGPLDPALDPAAADAARFPADARPGSPEWEAMTPEDQSHVSRIMANVGKALHAYQRLLVSRDAPFDRFVAGDETAIGEAAKRGLRLFIGKGACIECHEGPAFIHEEFHNNALRVEGDKARAEGTAPEAWPLGGRSAAIDFVLAYEFNTDSEYSDDRSTGHLSGLPVGTSELGKWRSRSLRQVAETAPYMRTGQLQTLREVVEFYNEGGHEDGFVGEKDDLMVELNLTNEEIDDIVAFLETLTGEEVDPALLQDTSN